MYISGPGTCVKIILPSFTRWLTVNNMFRGQTQMREFSCLWTNLLLQHILQNSLEHNVLKNMNCAQLYTPLITGRIQTLFTIIIHVDINTFVGKILFKLYTTQGI